MMIEEAKMIREYLQDYWYWLHQNIQMTCKQYMIEKIMKMRLGLPIFLKKLPNQWPILKTFYACKLQL